MHLEMQAPCQSKQNCCVVEEAERSLLSQDACRVVALDFVVHRSAGMLSESAVGPRKRFGPRAISRGTPGFLLATLEVPRNALRPVVVLVVVVIQVRVLVEEQEQLAV